MNPDNQEKELFNAALEQPAEKRDAFLRSICRGNEELRRRVEELLNAFNASSGILAETLPTTDQRVRLVVQSQGKSANRNQEDDRETRGKQGDQSVRRHFSLQVIKPGDKSAVRYLLEFGTYV